MLSFDLIDLRLFLHVVEAASITRGAARAHLALPSASARVRGLETALGTPLLERQPRGVRPTPAGRALAHHARLVLRQVDQLQGELGEYARGLKGHVRLLANTAAVAEFLPDALAPFLAAHPALDIDLDERMSDDIVPAVADGLTDLGIVSDAVDLGRLESRPFRDDRLALVLPRAHPLAARRRLAFADIAGQPLVGLSPGSALHDYLGRHAARAGHALQVRVRLRTFDAICGMVARGVGLAIVPDTAARRCRATMPLRIVRLTDAWATRRLLLCARRFDDLPLPARQLADHLTGTPSAARG